MGDSLRCNHEITIPVKDCGTILHQCQECEHLEPMDAAQLTRGQLRSIEMHNSLHLAIWLEARLAKLEEDNNEFPPAQTYQAKPARRHKSTEAQKEENLKSNLAYFGVDVLVEKS